MKTNQILTRQMGDFEVEQRTSDGMFNANKLLQQWNACDKNVRRRMDDFLKSPNTQKFIEAIKYDENERRNFAIPDNQIVMKGRAKTLSNGKRVPADIWMHPLLFIDFAMWINPSFKVKVLRFVYDQLLMFRNEAGDTYKNMCSEIAKITPKDKLTAVIQSTARGINHIVYGDHERNIRNLQAEENLMRELVEMQKKVTMYIEDGVITNPSGILLLLRNTWRRKYEPKTLTA